MLNTALKNTAITDDPPNPQENTFEINTETESKTFSE